jgi:hypothetical protein
MRAHARTLARRRARTRTGSASSVPATPAAPPHRALYPVTEPLKRPSCAQVRAHTHGKQNAGVRSAASSFAINPVVGMPLPSQGTAFPLSCRCPRVSSWTPCLVLTGCRHTSSPAEPFLAAEPHGHFSKQLPPLPNSVGLLSSHAGLHVVVAAKDPRDLVHPTNQGLRTQLPTPGLTTLDPTDLLRPTNPVPATPLTAFTCAAPDPGGIKYSCHLNNHGGSHMGYSWLKAADEATTSAPVAGLQTPKS